MTPPQTNDDSGELHPSADLGFVGMIVTGADTQAAWQKVQDKLKQDFIAQEIICSFAGSEAGRRLLDSSRRNWLEHGLQAPFDFLFEHVCRNCGSRFQREDFDFQICVLCRVRPLAAEGV